MIDVNMWGHMATFTAGTGERWKKGREVEEGLQFETRRMENWKIR